MFRSVQFIIISTVNILEFSYKNLSHSKSLDTKKKKNQFVANEKLDNGAIVSASFVITSAIKCISDEEQEKDNRRRYSRTICVGMLHQLSLSLAQFFASGWFFTVINWLLLHYHLTALLHTFIYLITYSFYFIATLECCRLFF